MYGTPSGIIGLAKKISIGLYPCYIRTGPRSRYARLHSAARDPFGIPNNHRDLLWYIAICLLPPGLPQFGLHSVVYSCRVMTTLYIEGINQYATPNIDNEG